MEKLLEYLVERRSGLKSIVNSVCTDAEYDRCTSILDEVEDIIEIAERQMREDKDE